MSKTAIIFHPAPTNVPTLALIPYGMYANKEIQNCETQYGGRPCGAEKVLRYE